MLFGPVARCCWTLSDHWEKKNLCAAIQYFSLVSGDVLMRKSVFMALLSYTCVSMRMENHLLRA